MDPNQLSDRDRRLIREQLLMAQSRWLEESEAEEMTPTLRTLNLIMADAFRQEAELYKSRATMINNGNGFFFTDEGTRDYSDGTTAGSERGGAAEDLPA